MAARLNMRALKLATGHKTDEMAIRYSSHQQDEDFDALSEAVKSAFPGS